MTITYSKEVASINKFGKFLKLLFRWKGSVYKMIWPEIIVYTIFYILFSVLYRYALPEGSKPHFERVALYCKSFVSTVPITFVLGFYVSLVVQRWWGQFETLPWPDNLSILVSNSIQGKDTRTRMMRRTIVRYANLSFALTARMISPSLLKNRFPTFDSLIEEGLLLDTEKKLLQETMEDASGNIYWVPLVWAVSLVETARRENYIKSELAAKVVVTELNKFRGNCGSLLSYDWINIPLVYTQVVTVAVYSYLIATVLGHQFVGEGSFDVYVPIFTYLQIIFYLGWLKVAESLVNPFGKDDEDFDIDGLIDRNMRMSYLIGDKMLDSHPQLHQDKHWDEVFHNQALIRTASQKKRDKEEEDLEAMDVILQDAEADEDLDV